MFVKYVTHQTSYFDKAILSKLLVNLDWDCGLVWNVSNCDILACTLSLFLHTSHLSLHKGGLSPKYLESPVCLHL